jgi:putative transposase
VSLTAAITDIPAAALQELIEAELTATIVAEHGERSPSRIAQRNGRRAELLSTLAGDIDVALMTAYITGTSTRKVDDLVKARGCDTGISKSSMSRIRKGIDADRPHRGPAGWTIIRSCTSGSTRPTSTSAKPARSSPKAVVIATGLRADDHREVLGVDVGDSENETFWTEFLRDLPTAGSMVSGWWSPTRTPELTAAIHKVLQDSRWHR